MNKLFLLGKLTRDPEVKYVSNGALAICNFTVAVDRPYQKDKPKETDFINCVAYGKTAEIIGNHFQKGKSILVEGRIQIRKYEAKDGTNRYATEAIVNSFEFVGNKNDNANNNSAYQGGFEGMGSVEPIINF